MPLVLLTSMRVEPGPTADEWVVLFNGGTTPATVSMTALAAGQPLDVEGVQDINVPAGRRVAVVCSGGNLAPAQLAALLRRHPVEA